MQLEINKNVIKDESAIVGNGNIIMITPAIDENYWIYRVKLYKNQAIVAFLKFGLIGIGFTIEEEDWNTNLPSQCSSEEIYQHIKCNKKYKQITKKMIIEAIDTIKEQVISDTPL